MQVLVLPPPPRGNPAVFDLLLLFVGLIAQVAPLGLLAFCLWQAYKLFHDPTVARAERKMLAWVVTGIVGTVLVYLLLPEVPSVEPAPQPDPFAPNPFEPDPFEPDPFEPDPVVPGELRGDSSDVEGPLGLPTG